MTSEYRSNSSRSQVGFTLIEVLVALTVTVIGLMGLMSLHTTTAKGNRDASRTAEANAIASDTMEALRAMPIDSGAYSVVGKYGALPVVDAEMTAIFGRADVMFTRTLSVEDLSSVSSNLVRLHLEVAWSDGGDDPALTDPQYRHSVAVELIRTRPEVL